MTIRHFRSRLPLFLLGIALAGLTWFAATNQPQVYAQAQKLGETSVVVPAGGEATIDFETFCLEFGKDFPTALGMPDGRAPDDVLRVLKTAVQEGLVDSESLQTQLAIWSLIEGGFPYPADEIDPSIAADLIERSADADISPIEGDGTALDVAVANGSIQATSENFTFVETDMVRPDGEPYKGRGTLLLTNTTDEDLTIFFSLGIVFRAGDEAQQDIVAYATELEEQPTPTPTPTETPAPTPTPTAPTPTPTATPPDRLPPTGADLSADVAHASTVNAAKRNGIAPRQLVIPSLDVETPVEAVDYAEAVDAYGVRYKNWDVAEYAAGWHDNSALPDAVGNVVISGHNNILGSVFRDLYKMQPGEQILLYQDGQPFVYKVDEVLLLPERDQGPDTMADNARWMADFGDKRLTLVSCWPEWSNTHRVVVVAFPVE